MAINGWSDNKDLKVVLPYVGSNYEIISKLGGGGTSNVYLIRHKFFDSDNERALKIIDTEYILKDTDGSITKYDEIKERFFQEAKLYKRIKHDNIVGIDDVDVVRDKVRGIDIPYLIMQYIKGETLKRKLASKIPLDIKTILKISYEMLSALQAIHNEKIIHRDMKSGNILIEQETGKAVLIDLGLAKDLLSKSDLTKSGKSLGTAQYMSPEQFADIRSISLTTDIYSFGIVLYEMITGQVPFTGAPHEIMYAHFNNPIPVIKERNPDAPPGLQKIIEKAMSKKPEDRYHSAQKFRAAIEELEIKYKKDIKKARPGEKKVEERKLGEEEKAKKPVEEEFKKPEEEEWRKKEKQESKTRLEEEKKRKQEEEAKKRAAEETIKAGKPAVAKPAGSKRKIVLAAAAIIAIIVFLIIVNPLGIGDGKHAMRNDFHALEIFLKGSANKEDKIARCRQFLQKHEMKAEDNDTKPMITWTKDSIDRIQKEIEKESAMEKDFQALNIEEKLIDKAAKEKKMAAGNEFLEKYKNMPGNNETTGMISQVNDFIKRLQQEIADEDAEYEKKNGKTVYDRMIQGKIDLPGYMAFIKKYPNSEFKEDLKKRLRDVDKNLPPEKYWNENLTKNSKGYYEKTLSNNHIMIYIPGKNFWIDKYEVSVEQFRQFDPVVAGNDDEPVMVTYDEAKAYCDKYGFRLPTEDEWEYAAGNARGYTYPWGNEAPDAGGIYRANYDTLDRGKDKDGYNGASPSRSFEQYSSPYGLVNMAGNVWEWVQGQILKGGSYSSSEIKLQIKNHSGTGYIGRGFRCIKEEK